jgi:hypothetical protein
MHITALGQFQRLTGALFMIIASCGGSNPSGPDGQGGTDSYGVDHTCTDISVIPDSLIESVQANIRMHYAHTSHGEQLILGLEQIESDDPFYDVEVGYSELPEASGALCIFDGQEGDTYITPELFWETPEGMDMTRDVLDHNPSINVCMWGWCTQLDYYDQSQVQVYLDAMTVLESEYPNVTFVYMTGNAQAEGAEGYNRNMRNTEIREYCENNNKLLFDFADLDCWWYNPSTSQWEHSVYSWQGVEVPVEHPQFHGDEAGHTTIESCRQKGRALWWLLAEIAGWSS